MVVSSNSIVRFLTFDIKKLGFRIHSLTGTYAMKELVWLNFSFCLKVAVHSFTGMAPRKNLISRGRAVCQSVKCFFPKFYEEMLGCTWQSLSQQ